MMLSMPVAFVDYKFSLFIGGRTSLAGSVIHQLYIHSVTNFMLFMNPPDHRKLLMLEDSINSSTPSKPHFSLFIVERTSLLGSGFEKIFYRESIMDFMLFNG